MTFLSQSFQLTKQINATIFRAYDIRGIVGETITPDIVYTIARAIAAEALDNDENTLAIARDGRLSGAELSVALAAGLRDGGCNVIDIDRVPTPVLYYATHYLPLRSGVMLTGSHNPAHYNGMKIVIGGETLSEERITNLYQRIISENLTTGNGDYQLHDVAPSYLQRITSDVQLSRRLKVVIDCGNGIAGLIAPTLYEMLGCEVIRLYCEVDGTFPNHHPDPSEHKNLIDLIAAVKHHQADVGIAFDGDGDRLGVVTESGEIINPDRQMMLFARQVLTNQPGGVVIYDVKCSRHLARIIAECGGDPIMSRTGHSLVKHEMKRHNALLGGEMSGHIFFQHRWYGFDDGLYAGARLLEIIAETDNDVFATLPNSINTPEIRLAIADDRKFDFVDEFISRAKFVDAEFILLDGLRVEYADGWGLLRASNTSPYLILRFEADTISALERIKNTFKQELLRVDNSLKLSF